jgi:exopolysaccharide production protein ExoZ
MAKQKIDSIQLLRAVAVSLVIFIHASYFGVPKISAVNPTDSFYHIKSWGAIGVDLFFAISGFIMTIVAPSYVKPGGWKKFFLKRIIRIIPLYYLLSGLDAAVSIFMHHQTLDATTIIKTLIFFPFFDHQKIVSPLISVGWSLSYEIYFYTLVGLLLAFKKNLFRNLLLVLLLLSVIGAIFNPGIVILRFLTNPLLLEFGFGIICGLIYKNFTIKETTSALAKTLAIALSVTGFGLMLITAFVTLKYDFHNASVIENNNVIALYRAMAWGIPSAIFLLGIILSEYNFRLKIPFLLTLAGDASYSCYLIHAQVFMVFAIVFKRLHLGVIPYLITIIPLCLGVSIIFYKLIEKPLVLGVDRLLNPKKA